MYVLTTGTAGEAAVMVEATHSLAGLVGSIHRLVAFNTDSWNTTQHMTRSEKSKEKTHSKHLYIYISMTHNDGFTHNFNNILILRFKWRTLFIYFTNTKESKAQRITV